MFLCFVRIGQRPGPASDESTLQSFKVVLFWEELASLLYTRQRSFQLESYVCKHWTRTDGSYNDANGDSFSDNKLDNKRTVVCNCVEQQDEILCCLRTRVIMDQQRVGIPSVSDHVVEIRATYTGDSNPDNQTWP